MAADGVGEAIVVALDYFDVWDLLPACERQVCVSVNPQTARQLPTCQ